MSRTPAHIVPVSRLDLRVEAGGWPEAEVHRAEIDAFFAALKADKPDIWNGRVILLRDCAVEGDAVRGTCIETDFAAFTWWRSQGRPAGFNASNIFALAALEGADGAFIMGEMGDHTVAGGAIYFPGGTPDEQDLKDGRLDLRGSVVREMAEEVGLSPADVREEEGWDLVRDGGYFGLMRRFVSSLPAEALAGRIRRFLAGEEKPELKDVRVIAGEADLSPSVTPLMADYVRWRWGLSGSRSGS